MRLPFSLLLFVVLCSPMVSAQPDVIVGSLNGINSYGNLGDIYAYAVGTTSCNIGDETLSWVLLVGVVLSLPLLRLATRDNQMIR